MNLHLDPKIASEIAFDGYSDPFSVLGMHDDEGGVFIRTYQPQARRVFVINTSTGEVLSEMERVHPGGIFQAFFEKTGFFKYKFKIELHNLDIYEAFDPYSFGPILSDFDLHLMSEGNHFESYEKMGAHKIAHQNVLGVSFAVWAPNARRVSVVGTFNEWDGRRHVMRKRGSFGVWELFIPGMEDGDIYKYEIIGTHGLMLPHKADPYAFQAEVRPQTASIVCDLKKLKFNTTDWTAKRKKINAQNAPMSTYEVHLGSWRRNPGEGMRFLTYKELKNELVPYVKDMGFTHVEFLPVTEHPFDGSWGYQTLGEFAPTSRYGTPEEFAELVDAFHKENIGVILDWVPAHFPKDAHGLAYFDGSPIYEHGDPRQGEHMDWGTKIFNMGRNEVFNFLISSALFWIRKYKIDGLRVDAVASMLYLDYSRKDGEWIPNQYGGRENLEAVRFLQRMNELIYGEDNGAITIAEESTAWPQVSRPTYTGGLGFGYKWNMGWMHDTLKYMAEDPVNRKYHHDKLTFGLVYAFNENFILPLSHDEVVHGKRSIIGRMPGDEWQKFANLRAYYAYMFAHPGKKLLFMGDEFAQGIEWNEGDSLQWHLTNYPNHRGIQRLVKTLNNFYTSEKSMHQIDFDHHGFEWIDFFDRENSVLAFLRRAEDPNDYVIAVCNFTPVVRPGYRIGVPDNLEFKEVFNSDDLSFGGSGVLNDKPLHAEEASYHGRPYSLTLTIPPLAVVYLKPVYPKKTKGKKTDA